MIHLVSICCRGCKVWFGGSPWLLFCPECRARRAAAFAASGHPLCRCGGRVSGGSLPRCRSCGRVPGLASPPCVQPLLF